MNKERTQTISLYKWYVYTENSKSSTRKFRWCFYCLLLPWKNIFTNIKSKKKVFISLTLSSHFIEESQGRNSNQETGEKDVKEHYCLVHLKVHNYQTQGHLHVTAHAQKNF